MTEYLIECTYVGPEDSTAGHYLVRVEREHSVNTQWSCEFEAKKTYIMSRRTPPLDITKITHDDYVRLHVTEILDPNHPARNLAILIGITPHGWEEYDAYLAWDVEAN